MSTAKQTDPLKPLTQKAAAALIGTTDRTLRSWADAPRRADGRYDGPALVQWLVDKRLAEQRDTLTMGDDAAMLAGGNSPALERWRLARAADAELSLAERKKELVDVTEYKEATRRMAMLLRRAIEQHGKRFGNDAQEHMEQGIDTAMAAATEYDDGIT